ncbi:hypothetical protein HPB50_013418 [Hyalomma asiaticum]|uniref:Uncharacterized protein n=1 Tax=Hyalomma asiaticum TaxID=266040 RepID=A0ACB7RIK9_HYAAI|nr:hypothetical protein HPB50_013418 [Hyalomma asiaticum]
MLRKAREKRQYLTLVKQVRDYPEAGIESEASPRRKIVASLRDAGDGAEGYVRSIQNVTQSVTEHLSSLKRNVGGIASKFGFFNL